MHRLPCACKILLTLLKLFLSLAGWTLGNEGNMSLMPYLSTNA